MKTQLPDKLQGVNKYHVGLVTNEKINQLIDCIAELTEVVEGKRTGATIIANQYQEIPKYDGNTTPTLKETLLGEIKSEVTTGYTDSIEVISWEDVEAIINRLMP